MNNRNGMDNKSLQGRAHPAEWAQASDIAGDAPFSFLVNIGTRLDEIPAWNPIYPNGRDAYLTRWARLETMIASAIFTTNWFFKIFYIRFNLFITIFFIS